MSTTKKFKVELDGNEAEMLIEAITDRSQFLSDTAAGLMKKKLVEASEPLYKTAQKLGGIKDRIIDAHNAAKE